VGLKSLLKKIPKFSQNEVDDLVKKELASASNDSNKELASVSNKNKILRDLIAAYEQRMRFNRDELH